MTEPVPPQPGRRAPAPDPLRLVQDFVNTLDIDAGLDLLATPEQASVWLKKRELVLARARVSEDDLRRCVEVRAALRALLTARSEAPVDKRWLKILNREAREATVELRFNDEGIPHLVPADKGIDTAIGEILAIVYLSRFNGTWTRLKVCGCETCGWVFYDHSRNRSSTWCSMAVCGNRTKVKSYRSRTRETPAN
ncbi:MAG: CGNR zinc finger domain-containing protein [Candidatus Dormibacteria bacterium]